MTRLLDWRGGGAAPAPRAAEGQRAPVAQWKERLPSKQRVVGSNPAGRAGIAAKNPRISGVFRFIGATWQRIGNVIEKVARRGPPAASALGCQLLPERFPGFAWAFPVSCWRRAC